MQLVRVAGVPLRRGCLVLTVLIVGCSDSKLQTVTGRVTLDQRVLENGLVTFIPTSLDGRPALGRTNAEGRFELMASRDETGIPIGDYKVSISTYDIATDANGKEYTVPERIPDKYNSKTELVATVGKGHNERDFDLVGELIPPRKRR